MSHYGNNVLPLLMQCEAEAHTPAPMRAARDPRDDDPDGWLAFRIGELCGEVAKRGGHPENQAALERTLCLAAGIPEPAPERNDGQPDLFSIAA